ncbi:MAG: 4Fe-4S dicluster domain-containing protein [Epsilonproteobacteria bacterium]|nr:MAG: 4Fe-4S dicluster domain-containing protein [Campylobacterota bacterium]
MSKNSIKPKRREFIKYTTLGTLVAAAGVGVGISPYILKAENRLRPPGAVDEKEFLALCIKCGQCLQVCPYHSIELTDIAYGHGVGTPHIDANIRGCYACKAVPCVLACPSGALDHSIEKATEIKMGIAVLEYPKRCLAVLKEPVPAGYDEKMKNFTNNHTHVHELETKLLEKFKGFEGKACTLCADMCPMPNAIECIEVKETKDGTIRPVVYDQCTGCGACQDVCPTDGPSIIIKPRMEYKDVYKS